MSKESEQEKIDNVYNGVEVAKRKQEFKGKVEDKKERMLTAQQKRDKMTRDHDLSMSYVPPKNVVLIEKGWVVKDVE